MKPNLTISVKMCCKGENRAFELNRGLYYNKLFNPGKEHMIDKSQLDDIKAFWTDIYDPPTPNPHPENKWHDLTGDYNINTGDRVEVT